MESVMNFLAEYYIWFFVAAGVLLFALIGFLIDSKKKKGQEFKGEAIETPSVAPTPVVETPVMQTTEVNTTPVMETAPVMPKVEASVQMPTARPETVAPTSVQETPAMDRTMEINDIPLAVTEEAHIEEVPVNPETQTISYGEPISVQTSDQNVAPVTPVIETPVVEHAFNNAKPTEEKKEEVEFFEELN